MGFVDGFKQGLSGEPDPRRFAVAGVNVACSHCKGRDFEQGRAMLNTLGLTFFGLDWANREAYLLICESCAHIDWFLSEPVPVG